MSKCKACAHPRRDELDRALAAKSAMRAIAREFVLSKDCVRRHRAHVAPKLDPLEAEFLPCPLHPGVPFYFRDRGWVCGGCGSWDGSLAYWKQPSAPLARSVEAGSHDASRDDGTEDEHSQGSGSATQ